ncbi:MAG: hypothetical protein IPP14_10455 [Planctomycetes bacterium]|nr:hypothetical protein [Planctomycetota bacterium]
MLEFARQSWLWLLALTLLFYVAYLLARRFRATRVTYGHAWQVAARKLRPPGWKRLLRTALTLLLSSLLLTSTAFYAAGLQRPAAEQPAPLLIALVLDTTPSMQSRQGGSSRAQLGLARANQILAAMAPSDRAVLYHFQQGQPVGGPWLNYQSRANEQPAVDFAQPDSAALAQAVAAWQDPPELPQEPAPQRMIWWLGDGPCPGTGESHAVPLRKGLGGDWRWLAGLPVLCESFGAAANNDALTGLDLELAPTDSPNLIQARARTRSGSPARLMAGDNSKNWPLQADHGVWSVLRSDGARYLHASTSQPDSLPQDDSVLYVPVPAPALQCVHLSFPAAEGQANPFLEGTLKILLPQRQWTADPAAADLEVMDRVATTTSARFAICFGALPEAWGKTGPAVAVHAGMQRGNAATDPGFELPDLALLTARDAIPLLDSPLQPLLRDPTGAVLMAQGTIGATRVLYCGLIPHQSNVLEDPSGPLLLLRWLQMVQSPPGLGLPLVLNPGEKADLRLAPGQVLVATLAQSAWGRPAGPTRFEIHAGANGRAKLGPLPIAGLWQIQDQDGTELGQVQALWADEAEQSLPFTPLPQVKLSGLQPGQEPDWRDLLPGALLWLALGLVALEWLLWLLGVTE